LLNYKLIFTQLGDDSFDSWNRVSEGWRSLKHENCPILSSIHLPPNANSHLENPNETYPEAVPSDRCPARFSMCASPDARRSPGALAGLGAAKVV
jgi:hypothetical protein